MVVSCIRVHRTRTRAYSRISFMITNIWTLKRSNLINKWCWWFLMSPAPRSDLWLWYIYFELRFRLADSAFFPALSLTISSVVPVVLPSSRPWKEPLCGSLFRKKIPSLKLSNKTRKWETSWFVAGAYLRRICLCPLYESVCHIPQGREDESIHETLG